jgi:hypothetical protein
MGTTNSLVNNLMMDSRQREPSVGDGATVLMWTDRYAATIVTVERFKTGRRAGEVKAVEVREDHAKRTDRNGQSESQTYEYSPNPSATVQRFTLRANGRYEQPGGGSGLLIGHREMYHDFTF